MIDQPRLHGEFRVFRHEGERQILEGVYPNALVLAGTHLLLQAGAGLLYGLSGNTLQLSSSYGVVGGPASYGAVNNKAFLGVGAGLVYTTLSGAVNAGATSSTVASATGFAVGDQVLLSDSSGAGLGAQSEIVYVSGVAGNVLTWHVPPAYAHNSGTRVVRMGSALDAGLPAGSAYYKGIDTGFPLEGVDANGNPCLTWQGTFASSGLAGVNEGAFVWNAAVIGVVPLNASPPGAGYSQGSSSAPGSAAILAVASLVPSPVDKTSDNSTRSLQYTLALRVS